MKNKKLLIQLFLFVIVIMLMVGCTSKTKTEYDDKQVAKIETRLYNGEGIVGYRMRLFDFQTGNVTDEAVISDIEFDFLLQLYMEDPSSYPEYKYENIEQYKEYLLANYNVPVKVAEFSKEDFNEFVCAAKSFGIYTWQESYVDDGICDATSKYIIITFADGTTKTTHCYQKYPKNFNKVEEAFKDYLSANAWCDLRLK
ncbi:MAG: hypothetical protein K2H02_04835 [Anaeroplasmataceae bacterium]|nr:hypothetical protein [Anaeroplasmataceae bacterium]